MIMEFRICTPRCQSFSWSLAGPREMNEFCRCQTALGKVIYCAGCLLGKDRLQAERITIRQTPYEIKVS